jgi:amidohydrolase
VGYLPRMYRILPLAALLAGAISAAAQSPSRPGPLDAEIARLTAAALPHVIAWRRDIHEHPELSGEEARTAKLVADHLRALGMEVRTNVGGHGVVALLKGDKPGPVVALRADMDALPVEEQVDLPFRSRVKSTYRGVPVGVMHACGHDNHVAILMGAAEVLASMKARLPGTVKFIFQPAEEGLPTGGGGAALMIRDGALDAPKVDAIFGLHVLPAPTGTIMWRSGPWLAASNSYSIVVRGRQTHGAAPWAGVDPIVIGSQIVGALQTIVARQTDITKVPSIVTVGAFQGGVRNNIIPDSVVMLGTIRTFDAEQRSEIFRRVTRTAQQIAAASGATATVVIDSGYPVTINDTSLARRARPTLMRIVGGTSFMETSLATGAEDFSYFQEKVPGVFIGLGVTPRDRDPRTVAANHSPLFFADEAALPTGMKAMVTLAVDYLTGVMK